jgi:hypothetical protein
MGIVLQQLEIREEFGVSHPHVVDISMKEFDQDGRHMLQITNGLTSVRMPLSPDPPSKARKPVLDLEDYGQEAPRVSTFQRRCRVCFTTAVGAERGPRKHSVRWNGGEVFRMPSGYGAVK